MSQYSFIFMGLSYAYDKGSDTISKKKLFKKKGKEEDISTINEKKERLRITASELDLNFMICFLIFLAQAAFIGFMFMEYIKTSSHVILGDYSINVTRLLCAIVLHANVQPECY